MSNTVVISHSEVESKLSCEAKHWYAFGDSTFGPLAGLEPRHFSDSLYRGIMGHQGLAVFYKNVQAGSTVDQAIEASLSYLRGLIVTQPEILKNAAYLNIITDLTDRILPRYFKTEAVDKLREGWFPLHVEETFHLVMDFGEHGKFDYPFTPDAIMRDKAGNLWVWDHKFVYNFYNSDEIELLPQIPKYIGALRAIGISIKGGYYNMLRWREVKDLQNHNRSEKFVPTDLRVQNAFRQQYNQMVDISEKKLNPDVWASNLTRVLSTMVCKSCSFKRLCAADLNGLDTSLMRRAEFQPNSYGYSAADASE